MGEEVDKLLVEPIGNATRPAILASLCLGVLNKVGSGDYILQVLLSVGAILFLLSSFFFFFYSIYTSRRILRVGTAVTFLLGLLCLVSASILVLITSFV